MLKMPVFESVFCYIQAIDKSRSWFPTLKKNKTSLWSERDPNPRPQDCECDATLPPRAIYIYYLFLKYLGKVNASLEILNYFLHLIFLERVIYFLWIGAIFIPYFRHVCPLVLQKQLPQNKGGTRHISLSTRLRFQFLLVLQIPRTLCRNLWDLEPV